MSSKYYARIHLDDENGPAKRSRHKIVFKASAVVNDVESLLVSTKSIVLGLQQTDLMQLISGRHVLIYPFPEWQGDPRYLVDFRRQKFALGGDFVVLHDMERGIYLKAEQEKIVEQAVPEAPPEGEHRYLQLTSVFSQGLPVHTEKETLENYLIRVFDILSVQVPVGEIIRDFRKWGKGASRFEAIQVSRVLFLIYKEKRTSVSDSIIVLEFFLLKDLPPNAIERDLQNACEAA
ncbi:hypothetical protein ACEPAF_5512 [Sanghuangporus sanghuang]